MFPLSPRALLLLLCIVALWIVWGIFAVTSVVPLILRHLTIYPWLTAWVLVFLPAVILGAWVLASTRPK
jgi:hypothetical protein